MCVEHFLIEDVNFDRLKVVSRLQKSYVFYISLESVNSMGILQDGLATLFKHVYTIVCCSSIPIP